ncbi:MAG: VOC family protein [Eubacteriales bacterium]|nr:VOC family protein [Eubacteriales bacterium]
MISNLTIGDLTMDCANAERARDFYADLMDWEKTTAYGALAVKTNKGMTILFWEPDMPYTPPVWPEESGEQQKQMHLDFAVDDMRSALEKAISLGATKATMQYGDEKTCVTMMDTEGHPFCFCKRQSEAEFGARFELKYYSVLADYSINIDCSDTKKLRAFYADLTNWDRGFHQTSLVAPGGMNVHFMQSDFDYIPPVWPEEPGKQQKQMHFNFQVDDLPSAVDEAIRLGATKAAAQYGGEHFVTLLDPVGHPFCLCRR